VTNANYEMQYFHYQGFCNDLNEKCFMMTNIQVSHNARWRTTSEASAEDDQGIDETSF